MRFVNKLDATNNNGFRAGCDATDKPYCSIGDGTDTITATWGSAISANTWYQINAGYDGTNAFISVNDGVRVTQVQSAPADTHKIYRIGYNGTNYSNGKKASGIDLSRTLSAEDIIKIFHNPPRGVN